MDTLELLIHGIIAAEANGKRVQTMKNNEAVVELQYMLCQYSHIRRRETEWEAVNMAIDALKAEAQPQENKPLTQEELRKMDGEPVWCVDGIGNVAWCLVSVWSNREEKSTGADCVDKNDGLWDATYYGMKGNGEHGLHAVGWLAYRRKPEVWDG